MKKTLFLVVLSLCLALALGLSTRTGVSAVPMGAAIAPVDDAWRAGLPKDPEAATRAYMARLSPAATARSNAYFRGGYWLILWNLLATLGAVALLMGTGASAALRDWAERTTRRRPLQTLLYTAGFVALLGALTLPLGVYAEFVREHRYGLATLTFGSWLREYLTGSLVSLLFLAVAMAAIYGVIRRFPRTWWAWGTGVGLTLLVVGLLLGPTLIDPLFNTYKPMAEGPTKQSILSMARANGVPVANVYQFDASKQTNRVSANVSGIFGTAAVRLNDNLLNRCTPAQVRGVMAHEIGHYVLNHVYKFLPFFALFLAAGFVFVSWGLTWATTRGGGSLRGPGDLAGMPVLVALFTVFLTVLSPIQNSMIRAQETEADIFALNASPEPDAIAEVELLLTEYRNPDPGPLEEFLFCDHPSPRRRVFNTMRWKAEHLP